jgi:multiple sugar transport system permease protein
LRRCGLASRFHQLRDQHGSLDGLLSALFGIDGPLRFNERRLAIGGDIVAFIWKRQPFWTVIFTVGRSTVPHDIYDAAAVDGAIGLRCFVHVTFPLPANSYLIGTLVTALWALGDFTTVYLVSGRAPSWSLQRDDGRRGHLRAATHRVIIARVRS